MAVGVDATGTKGKATVLGTTGISYTGLTIGASLSNGALLVGLAHDITVSSVAVVWDSGGTNQALTFIGLTTGPSGNEDTEWWGLINPVSGNKTLKVTWNAVTAEMYIGAISFTGVNQTGGATSFAHFNGATAISAAPSVAITSATGNIVVAAIAQDNNLNTVSGTLFWAIDNTGPNIGVGMFRSAGAASVTMSGSIGGTANWSISGVDIVAAGGAAAAPTLGWQAPLSVAKPVAQVAQSFSFVPFNTVQPSNSLPMQGWQQPLSKALPPVPVWPGFSFVPLNTPQISAQVVSLGWQSPLSAAPPVQVTIRNQGAQLPFVVPPFVVPGLGWQQPLSVAPPALARAPTGFSFVPFDTAQTQPTTPTGWQAALSTAPSPLKAPPSFAYVPFDTPQVVAQGATLGWQQPLSTAPPAARVPQSYSFVPFDTAQIAAQVVSLAWQQPLSIAVPRPASPAQSLAFVPFDTAQVQPAGIAGMAWFMPLGIAAQAAYTLRVYSFVPFDTVQITPIGAPELHDFQFFANVGKLMGH